MSVITEFGSAVEIILYTFPEFQIDAWRRSERNLESSNSETR